MKKARRAMILLLLILLSFISVDSATAKQKTIIWLFHGETCPHCKAERAFLNKIQTKYPELEVRQFEVFFNKSNAKFFSDVANAYGTKPSGVPMTFIGKSYVVGFGTENTTGKIIEEKIKACIDNGCPSPEEIIHKKTPSPNEEKKINDTVVIPVLGKVNVKEMGLPMFTVLIGFLDGFNPCAIWVLCFLLTLLIYARSRKKMLLIGSVFVLTSGLVYFMFMSAWLNFYLLTGIVNSLWKLIAAVAIVVGLINVKEFFFFKKGVSLTIPDKVKPSLFKKMRSLVKENQLPAILLGTVVLAFTANFFELICTFGFPAIYTGVLSAQKLPTITYYSYLTLYNIVYVIPLAVIVAVFTITMGTHKFGERGGRVLKLISGALMLALGLIMLLKPEMLVLG